MSVDLYVGPLSRYVARDWLTAAQKLMGPDKVHVVRVDPRTGKAVSKPALAWREDPRKHHKAMLNYMRTLARGLRSAINGELEWDERPDAPYESDQLPWQLFGALSLWAAYEEEPQLVPENIDIMGFDKDPAHCAVTTRARSRYSHLYRPTDLWIPVEMENLVLAPGLLGGEMGMGSSPRLVAQLEELNRRTWRADTRDLEAFRKEVTPSTSFEQSAIEGFARMLGMARKAVQVRMPMKLDY